MVFVQNHIKLQYSLYLIFQKTKQCDQKVALVIEKYVQVTGRIEKNTNKKHFHITT